MERILNPIEYDPIAPPGLFGTLHELRLPLDTLRWAPQWLGLARRRAAVPQTVLLLPGFGAGAGSMAPLAAYLCALGHRTHHWGLGRNTGDVPALLSAVRLRILALRQQAGGPVVLVGWSLGGYLAREAARDDPDAVRKVVTLGSPVIGGPRFTAVSAWSRARGHDLDDIERQVAERYTVPLRVPVAALYSKRDGVVAWQACIDHWSPNVRHIEVAESHLGLGVAPRALALVAGELDSIVKQT